MADYLLAQSSVLGSMLISPQIVGDVMTNLQPEDFTEPMGQEVFLAIRALHLAGEKIDPVCVLNQMGGPDPGRRKYLLALMRETPTAQNYREYMDIVREQSRLREIQRAGLALAGTDITLETAREPVSRLYELMMDRRGVECVDMEQGMLDFYAELERTPRYLPWGLDFLDEGLTAEGGDFVVLGGYPSDGKTALALSMAYAQAETLRVGFFSLETKTSKLFSRICSMVAQVSSQRIKRRELTEEDYFQLESKVDEVKKRRLSLIRASSMTVEDIRAYTLAHRFDVIYVDYLTLIRAPGKTEFDQATYISKALHQMAQDLNITVVALSQLSRPEGGKPKPPTLASLRSSGQIEQDADVVMFIFREEPGLLRSRRILRVAKNKEGETGQIPLVFRGETQTFRPDSVGIMLPRTKEEPQYKQMEFGALEDPGEDTPEEFTKN